MSMARITLVLTLVTTAAAQSEAIRPATQPTDLERWHQARLQGHRMLLRQIAVPQDAERFPSPFVAGVLGPRVYAGHDNLPWGHWVYVAPFWYIFRDLEAPADVPAHHPEQMTGPPDVLAADDNPGAWTSITEDSGREWLLIEFDPPVKATELHVCESLGPGAITRVSLMLLDGRELEAWSGTAGPVDEALRRLELQLPLGFEVPRVRIELDTAAVPGFNEIDAVGLVDARGVTHWATAAHARSTYTRLLHVRPENLSAEPPQPPLEARVLELSREVERLRQRVAELEAKLAGKGAGGSGSDR